jgi:hypothetical protein
MQRIRFGRFENLIVRNGQVVYDPPPNLIQVVRIGAEPLAATPDSTDWSLTTHWVELISEFGRIRDGVISRLEFRHGMPVLMESVVPARPGCPEVGTGEGDRG